MKVCPKCGGKNIVAVNPITGENIGILALSILLNQKGATIFGFCDDCHEMWTEVVK